MSVVLYEHQKRILELFSSAELHAEAKERFKAERKEKGRKTC